MTNVDKLKEEELVQLGEEMNLEDLIILGADKKIPLIIEYPNIDGTKTDAKLFCKQLTLRELENVNTSSNNLQDILPVLRKTLFKQNGDNFSKPELMEMPIGVLKALMIKIFELSGMHDEAKKLKDF